MKIKTLTSCFFLAFAISSCIQDEALNAEADIETCSVPGDVLNREPIIGNDEITLPLKKGADITKLAPEFTLTPGATIEPASGTVRDFTDTKDKPLLYTVTSEDKQWTKQYKVSAMFSGIPTSFHFEEVTPVNDKNGQPIFYNFQETDAIGNLLKWANANEGFNYTGVQAAADDYPTSPSPNGKVGNCVKLTTKSTGELGERLKMYIAAGNLFIGSFDTQNAVLAPLQATHFGFPFTKRPSKITGWFKYKAGEVFTDKSGNIVTGKKDKGDIYAVLYEVPSSDFSLDGNLFPNNGTGIDEHIALLARISEQEMTETSEWTKFDLEFKLQNGKTINTEDLKNGKYKLAVVFSSSVMGAYFQGAVGSELWIDEVEIICEN